MTTSARDYGSELHRGHAPGGRLYRPEIDGLRAIAVLPVILFHAGFSAFGGGYVGVDVFFVISGFLITTIIIEERAGGSFSLVRFYERRARRILPALFLVMAVSCILAWRLMLPDELAGFGQSLIAVVAFVSNILFWRANGYFDLAAEQKPLLHTWSLGVEEQFYIIFPLLVAVGWRLRRQNLMLLLSGIALLSLAFAQWWLHRNASGTFFLLPTRAWELLAGALLALHVSRDAASRAISDRWANRGAFVGIVLILGPVFAYGPTTPFPGLAAVPPVVGSLLLLAFATPVTFVGRLLTLPPLVGLGLVSYGAYLWHQPLFAFARLLSANPPPSWVFVLLSMASIVLAWLSWRFVEAPFKSRARWSRRKLFIGATAASLAFVASGAAMVATHGAPNRFTPRVLALLTPDKTRIDGCPAIDPWLHVCRIGAVSTVPTIVLLGDSHAYAIATAFGNALRRQGLAGYVVHTDCHPIPGIFDSREAITPDRVAFCAEANRRLLAFVTRPTIRAAIIAVRWTLRLYPLGQDIDAPAFDNGEGGVDPNTPFRENLTLDRNGLPTPAAAPKAAMLTAYVQHLAASKPVVLLYPVPEVGWNPERLNAVALAWGRGPSAMISTSWNRMRTRNAAVIHLLDEISSANVRRSDPQAIFCNTVVSGRCVVQANAAIYYFDDNHVSTAGARLIVAQIMPRLSH